MASLSIWSKAGRLSRLLGATDARVLVRLHNLPASMLGPRAGAQARSQAARRARAGQGAGLRGRLTCHAICFLRGLNSVTPGPSRPLVTARSRSFMRIA